MIIVDSNDRVHFDVNDPKSFLSPKVYSEFQTILADNKVNLETLLGNETAALTFVSEDQFLISTVKEIAGKRMVFLNNVKTNFSLIDEKSWGRLEKIAKHLKADLIQLEVPAKKLKELAQVAGVLSENYIFEKKLTHETKKETKFSPLNLKDEKVISKLAELEFLTRLDFPGSSVRAKDTFSAMKEEYQFFGDFPAIEGICIDNDPENGFMLWWMDKESETAIAIHVWVSERLRGQGHSKALTEAMLNHLANNNIKMCSYFVSANNLASVKNALKSGFELNFVAVNKYLSKDRY